MGLFISYEHYGDDNIQDVPKIALQTSKADSSSQNNLKKVPVNKDPKRFISFVTLEQLIAIKHFRVPKVYLILI